MSESSQAYERYAQAIALAQATHEKLTSYAYGDTIAPDNLPMLATDRLQTLFGDGDPANHIASFREIIVALDGASQYAVTAYLSGYPESELRRICDEPLEPALDDLRLAIWQYSSEQSTRPRAMYRKEYGEDPGARYERGIQLLAERTMQATGVSIGSVVREPVYIDEKRQQPKRINPSLSGDWRGEALCGDEPELFESERPRDIADAKELCGWCPVRDNCLYDAVKSNDHYGVRGGLTGDERASIGRKKRQKILIELGAVVGASKAVS